MSKTRTTRPHASPTCQSYLLRLWTEGGGSPWQASLQDVRTGEKYKFESLKDLLCFIEVKTEEVERG
jgi:hypothetical protein